MPLYLAEPNLGPPFQPCNQAGSGAPHGGTGHFLLLLMPPLRILTKFVKGTSRVRSLANSVTYWPQSDKVVPVICRLILL